MATPELLPLAESVADGSPIDWDSAEARATIDDQVVIRQLRVLASLAAVHRDTPATPAEASPPAPPAGPRSAIGDWAHLALVERLGGGTFGEVYRAWDRHLEREIALKLLRLDDTDDPASSRIAREGRLLARVRHPNVIAVHGVEIHEGRLGLCMELVRGTTLEEVLQKRGPFSANEAALIGIDLCRALAAIHHAGLIHRDVKAQNVMREDGGRVVLMDLGTGREAGPAAQHAQPDLAGTPLYLAPEIFDGAPASERTDLYSIGVLLYHLVTGSFPVPARTVDELRDAQAQGLGVRLRDARADLPTAFVRVVERAIARNPERRYASAGALEADLVEALHDSSASAGAPERFLAEWRRPAMFTALAIMLVAVAVLIWRTVADRSTASAPLPIRSIAVLPLKNLSGDPAQEYFADGMTDLLIEALGRLGSFKVISRTSAMQFKDSKKPISEIARTLHVDAVLEGSVLILPGGGGPGPNESRRVRINARLVHAGTETQVWNRTFEKVVSDVLVLESELAKAVAAALDQHLLSARDPAAAAARRNTMAQQFDVFDLYLKGRYYWNLRSEDGFKQSLQYFQEALNRSPQYALAYAGIADAYYLLGIYDFMPHAESRSRAMAAAQQALALDDSLGEPYASLGAIHCEQLEWDAAEPNFKRAIELNPAYVTAHHWYAVYLTRRGRTAEALAEVQRALELDPLSRGVNGELASVLMYMRRYDEAITSVEATLRLDPSLGRAHMVLAEVYAFKGDYARALVEAQSAVDTSGGAAEMQADLGYIYARSGRPDDARRILTELEQRYQRREDGAAGAIAIVYAGLDDRDAAFDWLERALLIFDPAIPELKMDARFDSLRADPRFGKLLAKAALP